MMNILAIIQARMDSSRLPKKVMMNLAGKPVLEHVVNRVKASKYIDDVVVATSINKSNFEIIKFCIDNQTRVFIGSEDDVLERYYQAAKLFSPEHVVRITSDCPMIDYKIIDKVIHRHLKSGSDYTSNTLVETYPDGQDIEIFKYSILEDAWKNAKLKYEREHVTPYMKNTKKYKCLNISNKENLSSKRWTIDQKEDYSFMQKVFDDLYKKDKLFGIDLILKLLSNNPHLEIINNNIIRNEGLANSLKNDNEITN